MEMYTMFLNLLMSIREERESWKRYIVYSYCKVAGTDASAQFDSFHSVTILEKYGHLKIGSLHGSQGTETNDDALMFGEGVPFGDPSWYQVYSVVFITRHLIHHIMVIHIKSYEVLCDSL